MYWIFISLIFFLFIVYAGLLVIYRSGFKNTALFKAPVEEVAPTTKVSIIIPARNEATNIERCLQSILANNYLTALLEIIVVDDHSTDRTAEIAAACSPLVKIIDLSLHISSPINSYKKMAIEIAVKQSTGSLIISTDADCLIPPMWIQTIVSFYNIKKSAFIAMPVSLTSSGGFVEKFQVIDFMVLQGITVGAVNNNIHPMCNGANMAYSKEAFEAVNGFEGVSKIASGDDMLLMQKIALAFPKKIHYLKSEEVIVRTAALPTLKGFLQQRIRWASKAGFYKDSGLNAVLGIVYFFNLFLFMAPFVALIFNPVLKVSSVHSINLFQIWILLLLLKIIIDGWFFYAVATFFKRKSLLPFFIIAQPFHIAYTVIAGWLGRFGQYQWKGRKVK